MNAPNKLSIILPLLLAPVLCFARDGSSAFHTGSQLIFYFDIVVIITALISIKQFFWPTSDNTPFQIFNLILTIVFFLVSFTFLIENKEFYEGYQSLDPMSCILKVFLSRDLSAVFQWVILLGGIINILYLIRNRNGYYDRV